MTIADPAAIAAAIDHTLLSPTAVADDIARLCDEAVQYRFASVCVNPRWTRFAADRLENSPVKVAAVIGFPLGADTASVKAFAADNAISSGADELDMVIDLAAVRARNYIHASKEIGSILSLCRRMNPPVTLKVIIESAALDHDEKLFAIQLCAERHVDFIKTSTGFHPAGGATLEDVRLIRQHAPKCRVKASGGIRTAADALAMIDAGAHRLGCSASVAIMQQLAGGTR